MVRNYKARSTSHNVPTDVIETALNDVLNVGRSIRSVASESKINPMTLCRYIKKAKQQGFGNVSAFLERTYKPIFTNTQEQTLKTYLKTAANVL